MQLRVSSLLAPCLSQFAVAVADDALWKQLNYQVLLKARHNLPQVSEMENVTLSLDQKPSDIILLYMANVTSLTARTLEFTIIFECYILLFTFLVFVYMKKMRQGFYIFITMVCLCLVACRSEV